MTSIPVNSPASSARPKFVVRLFLLGMVVPVSAGAIAFLFRATELPAWVRGLLALAPLVPLILALGVQRRALEQTDELARHVARESFVFSFYALFGLFICVDLLRSGGVLPGFAWNAKWLITAMAATLALGFLWTNRRYR